MHDDFLRSEALARSRAKNGTYLLSQTYPEGAPLHSAYPGGATSIGAVTATLLKAFFDESRVIIDPLPTLSPLHDGRHRQAQFFHRLEV